MASVCIFAFVADRGGLVGGRGLGVQVGRPADDQAYTWAAIGALVWAVSGLVLEFDPKVPRSRGRVPETEGWDWVGGEQGKEGLMRLTLKATMLS